MNPSTTPLSLRDRFACHALQGLLAADLTRGWDRSNVAQQAYMMADLMLLARRIESPATSTEDMSSKELTNTITQWVKSQLGDQAEPERILIRLTDGTSLAVTLDQLHNGQRPFFAGR